MDKSLAFIDSETDWYIVVIIGMFICCLLGYILLQVNEKDF